MRATTDWLSATTPYETSGVLVDSLVAVMDAAGASEAPVHSGRSFVLDFGRLNLRRMGRVLAVSASGSLLRGLRERGQFEPLLSALASEPHRVTRLDAAVDVPADAADFLPPVVDLAEAGAVSLGRKRVPSSRVRFVRSVRDDGRATGSLYFNGRGSRLTAVVYDKAFEALSKRGELLPPTTRVELRFSDVGATLRDAHDPTALFWHYCPPEILQRPAGVPEWQASADSFALPAFVPSPPVERLLALVDRSADFHRLCALAAEAGPVGVDALLSAVRRAVARAPAPPLPARPSSHQGLAVGA